jgi:excisionase family DNA binding protein
VIVAALVRLAQRAERLPPRAAALASALQAEGEQAKGRLQARQRLRATMEQMARPPTAAGLAASEAAGADSSSAPGHGLTVPEVASLLGLSERRTRFLAQRGLLRGHKVGQSWLLDPASAERYRQGRDRDHHLTGAGRPACP